MLTEELLARWREAQDKLKQAKEALDCFQQFVVKFQEEQAKIAEKLQFPSVAGLDHEAFKQFLSQPYLLMPRRQDSWYVVVPKFVDMQLGWLEWTTPSYNVFVINKYVRWMAPLPREIEERLGPTPTTQAKVVDGLLKVSAGMEEQAWQRYRKYLYKRDQFGIRIKRGYERHLLSSLIQDGYLPFTPRPVDKEDLNPPPAGFEPLPHQKEALDQWFRWGAVGVYWPGGMGKTYLGAAICAMVKGKKLVVVPNITEKEQWQVYLRKFNARDVQLETYSAWHKVQGKDYVLIVYDECHRLPAPVWSRFATVESKYRLGFSATPYREDGREDLIIALTGYPVGLSWEHFLQAKAIRKPRIICKVVPTDREKLNVLEDLLKIPMKTLIFVELIVSGEKIAKHFNLPFVYGNTKDRLDVINKNLVTVVSRVGDEGISIKDLERTIEVEFLGGSRRQEAQRAYRLLHSVKPEISHMVIMTVNELDQFGRRFLALEEKGFKIEYVS